MMISSVKVERRSIRLMVGAVLAGWLALGVSSCSSGPSAEAKTFCHAATFTSSTGPAVTSPSGPPFTGPRLGLSVEVKAVQAAEHSGDTGLDAAAATLLKAFNQHHLKGIGDGVQKVVAACTRLGLPPTRS